MALYPPVSSIYYLLYCEKIISIVLVNTSMSVGRPMWVEWVPTDPTGREPERLAPSTRCITGRVYSRFEGDGTIPPVPIPHRTVAFFGV